MKGKSLGITSDHEKGLNWVGESELHWGDYLLVAVEFTRERGGDERLRERFSYSVPEGNSVG